MNLDFNSLSAGLFNKEVDKIPEPYRTKFIEIVEKTQARLENKTFEGDAGAGLLKMTVDNKGAVKSLHIDPELINRPDWKDTDKLISTLSVTAHSNALENVKKAIDKELANLYSDILALTNEIIQDKSNQR